MSNRLKPSFIQMVFLLAYFRGKAINIHCKGNERNTFIVNGVSIIEKA